MWYFDEEELLLTHYALIERFRGSRGIRDIERIRSVLEAPKQSAFRQEQYPGAFVKAATYARNIIADHPFVDGNKRTGITCAIMFLRQNEVEVVFEKKELENYAVRIATDKLSVEEIAAWLKKHSI